MNRPAARLAALLAVLTVLRLLVAALVPLAPDEAYYWVWSRALAPGYLDHPPMVALWIRAGTLLAGQTPLGVRLLGPLSAALASWMIYDAGRVLFQGTAAGGTTAGGTTVGGTTVGGTKARGTKARGTNARGTKAGVTAAVLLNATLLLGVGTAIMTPDTPLLFFWAATLWATSRLAAGGTGSWWLAAGAFGGLALVSKYTGLFLWIGIGLWVLWVPVMRRWLLRWQPWAATLVGFALFAPVLIWNAEHRWAGFIKQGGRVGDWDPGRALGFISELIGAQIGLATPLVFALCMLGLGRAVSRAWRHRDPAWSLLAALSLPPILTFLQHAIGDRVQGNWPAIIYPALVIAAGALAIPRKWLNAAVALGLAITALAYLQATTRLLPLPPKSDPVAIRLAGWDGLAGQVDDAGRSAGATCVIADGYSLASELAWWLPVGTPVLSPDGRWALTTLPVTRCGPALLVRDARRSDAPPAGAIPAGSVHRPGAPDGGYALFRLDTAQAAELPRR